MENQKLGIANLTPIIMLAFELGNVGDKMGRTKGMARYLELTSLFDEVTALGKVDFKAAKAEFLDLDEAERETLLGKIRDKFDIVDDKLEAAIEEGLDIVDDMVSAVMRSVDLYKKLKA